MLGNFCEDDPVIPLAQLLAATACGRRSACLWGIVLAAATSMSAAAPAPKPDLSWIDFAAVDAGESVLRTDKAPGNGVKIDVAARIDAPKERIWEILRECDIAPEIVPNVVACRRLESLNDGRSELFEQTVKPAFFVPRFEHVFRLDYFPYERMEVHRVSGPIEEMDGMWWLLDREDGSVLVVHSLVLRPGIAVPRFFVRATLRRDLPAIMHAVRDRAQRVSD
jgi:Polyketide cyclase / dehydrase and lipid transport